MARIVYGGTFDPVHLGHLAIARAVAGIYDDTVWLMPAAALLPGIDRRRWLAAQAAVALLVNHLLWTGW